MRPTSMPARSRNCVVASMALVALMGTGCDGTRIEEGQRDVDPTDVLAMLNAAWAAGELDDLPTDASPQARSWASMVQRNITLLDVEDVSLHWVGGSAPARSGFVGDVEVRSATAQNGARPWVIVSMRFDASGLPVAVADATSSADPLPVWLSSRVQVVHERGVTLIGFGRDAHLARVRLIAARAAQDVQAALGKRLPVVTVVLPRDAETANRLLGSSPSALDQIAAVTATVDGSADRDAPVQVVLNRPVFDSLGRKAARFVLAHEMAHATTGATTSSMALWVAEGFADYVALRSTRLPVDVTAGQTLAKVDLSGPPKRLPAAGDFARQAPGLGGAYEAAWLVFRMLAAEYGHRAAVGFYLSVRDGASLPRALDDAFSLDVTALTAAWRSYLRGLAKAA